MPPFYNIIVILICATCLLYLFLKRHAAMLNNLEVEVEKTRMLNSPQSGFWINCANHGSLPLSQAEYNKQCKAEKYRCPFCGQIPRKIWKDLAKT